MVVIVIVVVAIVVVIVVVAIVVVIVVVAVIVVFTVVVVSCSCRPTPTVLGQVAKLLAVIACCISPACVLPFVLLLVLVISGSVFKLPLVFCLSLSKSVTSPIH
ncbi:hypothetical protein Tco_0452088 [Tanacetum coccineum]